MNDKLEQARIPFRIVIFPMPEQVWNTTATTLAYQDRLQQISREIGVPTLDLLPAFRKAASDGKSLYIHWDWHPNAAGHQVAARAIASFVLPQVTEWMARNSVLDSSSLSSIRSALPASKR